MKLQVLRRSNKEYNYSKKAATELDNISGEKIIYKEYGTMDEMYKRCKEAARCYAAVGNIPMMLNKLYATLNLEKKICGNN